MTKTQFTNYISYSTVRPARIGVGRWTAMIRWAKVNGFIS